MGHVEFSVFVGEPVTDVQYGVQVWGSISSEIFVESKFMCPTRREAKPKPGVGAEKGPIARAIQGEQGSSCARPELLKGPQGTFQGESEGGQSPE